MLLHAQTIQMCKVEEENGNAGALGRQYVYEALAQAIISPSGKLTLFQPSSKDQSWMSKSVWMKYSRHFNT